MESLNKWTDSDTRDKPIPSSAAASAAAIFMNTTLSTSTASAPPAPPSQTIVKKRSSRTGAISPLITKAAAASAVPSAPPPEKKSKLGSDAEAGSSNSLQQLQEQLLEQPLGRFANVLGGKRRHGSQQAHLLVPRAGNRRSLCQCSLLEDRHWRGSSRGPPRGS